MEQPCPQTTGVRTLTRFYHKETGEVSPISVIASSQALLEANTPTDHLPIEGVDDRDIDHLQHRVDVHTGKVKPL